MLISLGFEQLEDIEWYLVRDLSPGKPSGTEEYRKALLDLSPEAGGFILISLRRRKKRAVHEQSQDQTE
jgi:hypothetical protein